MNTIRHWIAEHWLDIAAALLVIWYLNHQNPTKESITISLKPPCTTEPPTISQHYKI